MEFRLLNGTRAPLYVRLLVFGLLDSEDIDGDSLKQELESVEFPSREDTELVSIIHPKV